MAKLSARGATVLAKVVKVTTEDGIETKIIVALRSDRKLLRRVSTRKVEGESWQTRWSEGGYSIRGTLKPELTPEQWLANRLAQGWEVSR